MAYIELDSDINAAKREIGLSKAIAETLHRHYPGHLWAVNVDCKQGVATIQNMNLSGQWGFYLHLKELVNDPFLKKVVQAGGEILERYRLSRGEIDEDKLLSLKRDFSNNFVVDAA